MWGHFLSMWQLLFCWYIFIDFYLFCCVDSHKNLVSASYVGWDVLLAFESPSSCFSVIFKSLRSVQMRLLLADHSAVICTCLNFVLLIAISGIQDLLPKAVSSAFCGNIVFCSHRLSVVPLWLLCNFLFDKNLPIALYWSSMRILCNIQKE